MNSDNKNNSVSRRKFLGAGLGLPFLSVAKPFAASAATQAADDDFVIMLNAEGKAVKVKKEALKKAKVIGKKMSNQSLLGWLKPKGFASNEK